MPDTSGRLTVRWGRTSNPSPAGHPDRIRWRDESVIEDVTGSVVVRMTPEQWVAFQDETDGGEFKDRIFDAVAREARDEDSRLNVTDWSIQKASQEHNLVTVSFFPKSWQTGPERR